MRRALVTIVAVSLLPMLGSCGDRASNDASQKSVSTKTQAADSNAVFVAVHKRSEHELRAVLSAEPKAANYRDHDGNTPLHVLALTSFESYSTKVDDNTMTRVERDVPIANLLLSAGADVNAKDEETGATPLLMAITTGKLPLARFFIDKGADVACATERGPQRGATPLHSGVGRGYTELVQILINKGANINAAAENGTTPLHLAVGCGHTQLVRLLIAEGANINAKDKDGNTPLHIAAIYTWPDAAQELIERGARQDVRNEKDDTPLVCAQSAGSDTVATLLRENKIKE